MTDVRNARTLEKKPPFWDGSEPYGFIESVFSLPLSEQTAGKHIIRNMPPTSVEYLPNYTVCALNIRCAYGSDVCRTKLQNTHM